MEMIMLNGEDEVVVSFLFDAVISFDRGYTVVGVCVAVKMI